MNHTLKALTTAGYTVERELQKKGDESNLIGINSILRYEYPINHCC